MDSWSVCRLCLQSNEASMKSLPDVMYELIPFSNIYYELMGITFTNYPSFPGIICSSCENQIIQAYKFRERCLETEEKLKELLNDGSTNIESKPIIEESGSSKKDQAGREDKEGEIEREDQTIDVGVEDDVKCEKSTKKVVTVTQKQMKELETKTIQCSKCKTLFQGIAKFRGHQCNLPLEVEESEVMPMDEDFFDDGEPPEPETIRPKQKTTYKCEKCGRIYLSRNNFYVHMDKHNNVKRYPCKHCDERFSCWIKRRSHMFDVHFKKKYCECPHCDEGFNTTQRLNHHIQTHHNQTKEHQCEKCGKTFGDKAHLRSHYQTHGESQVKCEICGKMLKHIMSLIDHQKLHGKVEIKKCDYCGRKCKGEVSLKYHMSKMHSEVLHLTQSEATGGEKSTENSEECSEK